MFRRIFIRAFPSPVKWSFLEVTPEVGGRATLYSVRNGREETESQQSWDFKTTVATEMYRVFDTGVCRGFQTQTLDSPRNHLFVPAGYEPVLDSVQVPLLLRPDRGQEKCLNSSGLASA